MVRLSRKVLSGVPSLPAAVTSDSDRVSPNNLQWELLDEIDFPGAPGDVLTSMGTGRAPVWKKVAMAPASTAAGLRLVDTLPDLLNPAAQAPKHGETVLVRFDADGVTPLWRLGVYDMQLPSKTPGGAPGGWVFSDTPKIFVRLLQADQAAVDSGVSAAILQDGDLDVVVESLHESINVWSNNAWTPVYDYERDRDRLISLWADDYNDLPAPALGSPITAGRIVAVKLKLNGDYYHRFFMWEESAPEAGGVAQAGDWIPVGIHVHDKPLGSDPDPTDDVASQDLLVSAGAGAEQIKHYDGTAWQTVFDYRDVRARILREAGFGMAGRVGNLPSPADPDPDRRPVLGKPYLVKMDLAGETLDRIGIWDDSLTVVGGVAALYVDVPPAEVGHVQAEAAGGGSWPGEPFEKAGNGDCVYVLQPNADGTVSATVTRPGTGYAVGDAEKEGPYGSIASLTVRVVQLTGATPHGGWRFVTLHDWIKTKQSAADHQYGMEPGDFQATTEKDAEELKVWNGTAWITLVSTQQIKAWISSLNLFEGTTQEIGGTVVGATDFSALPDLTAATSSDLSAHYYTFVGSPGYAIKAGDPSGLGADLTGAVLNPGDWLQIVNRGTVAAPDMHWVHIGGDLLAKSRADSLYSLNPWVDANYEQGSLVNYAGSIWKANSAIITGDVAPDATGSKWSRIALTAGVKNVQTDGDLPATAAPQDVYLVLNSVKGGNKPALFSYDLGTKKWVQLGGGADGVPLQLAGGNLIYPDILYWDGSGTSPGGRVINDLLFTGNSNALKRWDGSKWIDILLNVPFGQASNKGKLVIMDGQGNPSISSQTADSMIKQAVLKVWPNLMQPAEDPPEANGHVDSFYWRSCKTGSKHTWLMKASVNAPVQPVLYLNASSVAENTQRHFWISGILYAGTGQFQFKRDENQAKKNYWFKHLDYGDANNKVHAGRLFSIEITWYQCEKKNETWAYYTSRYRRHTDDMDCVIHGNFWIPGYDYTGYAINTYTSDHLEEVKIF